EFSELASRRRRDGSHRPSPDEPEPFNGNAITGFGDLACRALGFTPQGNFSKAIFQNVPVSASARSSRARRRCQRPRSKLSAPSLDAIVEGECRSQCASGDKLECQV